MLHLVTSGTTLAFFLVVVLRFFLLLYNCAILVQQLILDTGPKISVFSPCWGHKAAITVAVFGTSAPAVSPPSPPVPHSSE